MSVRAVNEWVYIKREVLCRSNTNNNPILFQRITMTEIQKSHKRKIFGECKIIAHVVFGQTDS